MLLLDTHVWVWSVHNDTRLSPAHRRLLEHTKSVDIGVSAISCWEIAKLVSLQRLVLNRPLDEWFNNAIESSGIRLFELTAKISVEANRLPGVFHRDPADCIIVATARVHGLKLLTVDRKILDFSYIETI